MTKAIVALVTIAGIVSLLFIMSLLFAYPTMWLVNYLFSAQILSIVFGAAKLNVWQAMALNVFLGFVGGSKNFSTKEKS
jgi:hypothetical protein